MREIIKTTLKLLVRNKGFWFFLIISPLLSTLCLKNKKENLAYYSEHKKAQIEELENIDDKVAYFAERDNGKFIIKIYDASGSELSEYLLNKLLESGAFKLCRVKTPDMTKEDADAHMEYDGYNDRMGAAIYLDKDFDKYILVNDISKAFTVYVLSDDERYEILINEIKNNIGQIKYAAEISKASGNESDIAKVLEEMNDSLPKKEVQSLAGKDKRELTHNQIDKKTLIGYAFAILTLGFVFGGIFIAHTVINEQKDMVLTRLKLTNLTNTKYFLAKFICGAFVCILLTIIMGLCTVIFKVNDLGIGMFEFLLMIFLMGLIFCSISLLLGILLGNVMSANVAAFTIWSMSSMLAGLYFPLDATSKAIKTLSYMMPQKWFLEATEMIMTKDNMAYFMLLCITAVYMIVTMSLGSVGIKFKNYE